MTWSVQIPSAGPEQQIGVFTTEDQTDLQQQRRKHTHLELEERIYPETTDMDMETSSLFSLWVQKFNCFFYCKNIIEGGLDVEGSSIQNGRPSCCAVTVVDASSLVLGSSEVET